MKLLRVGAKGAEKPAILDENGRVRDLSALVGDIAGPDLGPDGLDEIRRVDPLRLPEMAPGRIGPCVGGVGKILCIGLNYADHAAESKMTAPEEPLVFMKATSAITGPNDPIVIPRGSTATDYEVELAIVIGRRARYVSEDAALEHVAGYCIVNDVSERDFQKNRGGQFVKGKSADSFAPLGPWLVTRDEVPDPTALSLKLSVDGDVRQSATTRAMVHKPAFLVHYLSQFMTLNPGDIIATGTPAGVGMGMDPPGYLKSGQLVRAEVEGLGVQENSVEDCPL